MKFLELYVVVSSEMRGSSDEQAFTGAENPKRGLPPVSVASPEVGRPQTDQLRPEHSDRSWVIGAECFIRQVGALRRARRSHTLGMEIMQKEKRVRHS